MFSGCKKKELTVSDLQKKKAKYEGLCEVYYYHGGGMEGSSFSFSLEKEAGRVLLKQEERNYAGQVSLCYVYQTEDIFEELDDIVKEYNLSVWDEIPESEYFALDAPSTHMTLTFLPEEGGKFNRSMTIDYDKELPQGGVEILNDFVKRILSLRKEENLIDISFEAIRLARDIENSEEEIEKILLGYWNCEDGLLEYGYSNEAELYLNQQNKKTYVLKETVNEPYKEANSSWYQIYVNQEDEEDLFYLAFDLPYLLIEYEDGTLFKFQRGV